MHFCRNDPLPATGCAGIPCIVDAVHKGDDRRIDALLSSFVHRADLEALFALRAALDAGPGAERRDNGAGCQGVRTE
jgi:hypothetical protein